MLPAVRKAVNAGMMVGMPHSASGQSEDDSLTTHTAGTFFDIGVVPLSDMISETATVWRCGRLQTLRTPKRRCRHLANEISASIPL